jgi:hypothetical protein
LQSLDLSVSYTPNKWNNNLDNVQGDIDKDEQYHAAIKYSTAKLSGFLAGKYDFYAFYNQADFYDLFGPTKRSRKGINIGVDHNQSLIYDNPRNLDLNLGASAYYGLDQSPAFQQIDLTGQDFNTNIYYNMYASLSYRNLKGSVGAVDAEKGIKSSLTLANTITKGQFFPRIYGTLDLGFQLPIDHTSFWIRNAFGNSFSKEFNPFTRFGFAAFGNNYIDNVSSKMYRRPFSFAGLQYDAEKSIIAKSFVKSTLELALPPLRYRKLGFFNLFATHSHATIFAGALYTNNYETTTDVNQASNIKYSERFKNIGFQVDTKLVMFSHLHSTFSFGWARAFEMRNDKNSYDEWMISLKF